MGLTIDMVLALHKRAPGKVNLTYKRPGGTMGYCYIDPSKPMVIAKGPLGVGTLIQYISDWKQFENSAYMVFYKQQSNAQLMLDITKVEFQNKNKEELLRLIYAPN